MEHRGIVVRRPVEKKRSLHRESARVPTDLTVRVREQVHVRRYDAALVNLSGGGCMLQMMEAVFDFSTLLEISLSLPGEPLYTILGQVAHSSEAPGNGGHRLHLYGVRFVELDPAAAKAINEYIWQKLRVLYSNA